MRHDTRHISCKILVVFSFVFLFVLNKQTNPAVSVCSKYQAMTQFNIEIIVIVFLGIFWSVFGFVFLNISESISLK